MDRFKHVCRIHTEFMVARYLMSNADGRQDGAEKAQRHMELCEFYVSAVRGLDVARIGVNAEVNLVHTETQKLTSYLDQEIGFPLKGRPDYEKLKPLFFEKFHALAMGMLDT